MTFYTAFWFQNPCSLLSECHLSWAYCRSHLPWQRNMVFLDLSKWIFSLVFEKNSTSVSLFYNAYIYPLDILSEAGIIENTELSSGPHRTVQYMIIHCSYSLFDLFTLSLLFCWNQNFYYILCGWVMMFLLLHSSLILYHPQMLLFMDTL